MAPVAAIEGTKTRLSNPQSIAFDRAGNLYVAGFEGNASGAITEYAAGAAGNVAPITRIAGRQTSLGYLSGIAIDDPFDIFTCQFDKSGSEILKFKRGSSGNVPPVASAVVNLTTEIQVSGPTLYASMPTFRRYVPSITRFNTFDLSLAREITNQRFRFPFADIDTAGRIYVQNFIRTTAGQLRGQLFEFGPGGEGPDRVRFDGLAEAGGYIVVGP